MVCCPFRNIRRLLLLHGEWNYHRVSVAANLCYLRSMAYVSMGAFILYFNGFSGEPIFTTLFYPTFDPVMTIFGTAAYSLFDKHISEIDILPRPYLDKIVGNFLKKKPNI